MRLHGTLLRFVSRDKKCQVIYVFPPMVRRQGCIVHHDQKYYGSQFRSLWYSTCELSRAWRATLIANRLWAICEKVTYNRQDCSVHIEFGELLDGNGVIYTVKSLHEIHRADLNGVTSFFNLAMNRVKQAHKVMIHRASLHVSVLTRVNLRD